MTCNNEDHERFGGVFFARNGCLACELEISEMRNNLLEIILLKIYKYDNEIFKKADCTCWQLRSIFSILAERESKSIDYARLNKLELNKLISNSTLRRGAENPPQNESRKY